MDDFLAEIRLNVASCAELDNYHTLTFQRPLTVKEKDAVIDIASKHLVDAHAHREGNSYFLNYNACIGCGAMLGACNPRQFCRKIYCPKISSR